ncbi:MAG TPA: hypothetical protein ENN09_07605 [Planctomycetes bacterium]|nr:hypothetical protein [Planctomycetota bacterium]
MPKTIRVVPLLTEVLVCATAAVLAAAVLLPHAKRSREAAENSSAVQRARSALAARRLYTAPLVRTVETADARIDAVPLPSFSRAAGIFELHEAETAAAHAEPAGDTAAEDCLLSAVAAAGALSAAQAPQREMPLLTTLKPETAAWASVGGCGVGGSGGGGSVRWIGRRVPGGRVETELLATYSAGDDLKTAKTNVKVTAEVPGRFNVGLQIPYLYSERRDADYEAMIGEERPLRVHELGDLNLLVSRKFGMAGNIVANLTIGIPTAPHDVSQDAWHVPYDAQPGRGKLTLSLGAEHIVEKYYGPLIVGGSYNYLGGENDVGDFKADSISAFCFFSYRAERLVHSLGGTLTYAFEEDRNLGAVIADQPLLLFTIQYGLELSFPKFPMYIAATGTFSGDGMEAFGVSLGVMTAF